MAAQRKQAEASRARWVAEMPKSIRPLWERVTMGDLGPDVEPFRAPLAKEFPDMHIKPFEPLLLVFQHRITRP